MEVLHLLPKLVAAVAASADEELALNRVLNGIVAWQEPPLRPDTVDRFIEGKTIRSVLVDSARPALASSYYDRGGAPSSSSWWSFEQQQQQRRRQLRASERHSAAFSPASSRSAPPSTPFSKVRPHGGDTVVTRRW